MTHELAALPMCMPDITDAEREAVLEVLASPSLALGPKLVEFEKNLAARCGARHGIGVNSGTSGLHLAMIAAGVGPGDVVLTTPFSFVASANCVLYVGGRPEFVDIEPDTLTIDVGALEQRIEKLAAEGVPMKAILPVHVFGQPCDMDPIVDLAERHGLAVIEDACEAIGGTYKDRPVGALGHAGVFAFYPNKQMTTGEGGMLVTDDAEWADLFRSLRNQGRDVFDGWLEHSRLGYNSRLDEMSAALGVVQLRRLDELLDARERVARWYDERLGGAEGVQIPKHAPWTTRASWLRCSRPCSRSTAMACCWPTTTVPTAACSRRPARWPSPGVPASPSTSTCWPMTRWRWRWPRPRGRGRRWQRSRPCRRHR